MSATHRRWMSTLALVLLAAGCRTGMIGEGDPLAMDRPSLQGTRGDDRPDPLSTRAMAEARELERSGQMKAALQRYVKIAEANPGMPAVWHRMAVAYDKVGHRDYAATCYDRALELDPLNADLWCDLGYGNFLHGDFISAEQSFRRALELQPGNQRAHNNLGLALAKQGQSSAAKQQFQLAGCSADQASENLRLACDAPIAPQIMMNSPAVATDATQPLPEVAQQMPEFVPQMPEFVPQMPEFVPQMPEVTPQSSEVVQQMPAVDLPMPIADSSTDLLPVTASPSEQESAVQSTSAAPDVPVDVARLNYYATDPSVTLPQPLPLAPMEMDDELPAPMTIGDDAPKTFAPSTKESFAKPAAPRDEVGVYNLISDFEEIPQATGASGEAKAKSEVVRIGDLD